MKIMDRRGFFLVLSSPSGAGKTTLAKRLLAEDGDLALSVSVTTRNARPGEADGVDYHFIDQAHFETMVAERALLEHATVFGKSYGTPRTPVETRLAQGLDILSDLDWQGTQQLRASIPDDLVSIYVLPPSLDELHRRLVARGQDSVEIIDRRMAEARAEISHWMDYDYVLINHDVDRCTDILRSILVAERAKRTRQRGLIHFVNRMIAD